jgi:hypothetical protein
MSKQFFLESLKGRDLSEYKDIDRRIISKRILRKLCNRMWTASSRLKVTTVAGC